MLEFNRNIFNFIVTHHLTLEKSDWQSKKIQYTVWRSGAKGIFRWVFDLTRHHKLDKEIKYMALMSFYALSGMSRFVHRIFDEMPQRKYDRTVNSLNVLLASYLHSRKFYQVNKAFRTLPTQVSIEPNLMSYHILIMAFCEKGSFDLALSMLKEMKENGVEPDHITYKIVLDKLYLKGNFEDGEKVWKEMVANDVDHCEWSYCSKLTGLVKNKRVMEAVELFNKMIEEGYVVPNIFCINVIIKGFVNCENLEAAKKWFNQIERLGLQPHKSTYDILVPFLCKKGDLKTLIEMCYKIFHKQCPVNPWMLELVVDKLFHEGMNSEARNIVINADFFLNYHLNCVDEKTLADIYKYYGC